MDSNASQGGGLIHLQPVATSSYVNHKNNMQLSYEQDEQQSIDRSPHNQIINQSDLMGGGPHRVTEGTIVSGLSGGYYNRAKTMTSHTLQYHGTANNTDRRISTAIPQVHQVHQSRTTVANQSRILQGEGGPFS
jgi:hypothetical protein